MMKGKLILAMLIFAAALSFNALAAGCGTYTASTGYYAYPQTPVRVGGMFGQSSGFLMGLRAGTCATPTVNRYGSNYYGGYTRVGGWYGGGYLGWRGGTTSYPYSTTGYNTAYRSPSYVYHGPL